MTQLNRIMVLLTDLNQLQELKFNADYYFNVTNEQSKNKFNATGSAATLVLNILAIKHEMIYNKKLHETGYYIGQHVLTNKIAEVQTVDEYCCISNNMDLNHQI